MKKILIAFLIALLAGCSPQLTEEEKTNQTKLVNQLEEAHEDLDFLISNWFEMSNYERDMKSLNVYGKLDLAKITASKRNLDSEYIEDLTNYMKQVSVDISDANTVSIDELKEKQSLLSSWITILSNDGYWLNGVNKKTFEDIGYEYIGEVNEFSIYSIDDVNSVQPRKKESEHLLFTEEKIFVVEKDNLFFTIDDLVTESSVEELIDVGIVTKTVTLEKSQIFYKNRIFEYVNEFENEFFDHNSTSLDKRKFYTINYSIFKLTEGETPLEDYVYDYGTIGYFNISEPEGTQYIIMARTISPLIDIIPRNDYLVSFLRTFENNDYNIVINPILDDNEVYFEGNFYERVNSYKEYDLYQLRSDQQIICLDMEIILFVDEEREYYGTDCLDLYIIYKEGELYKYGYWTANSLEELEDLMELGYPVYWIED